MRAVPTGRTMEVVPAERNLILASMCGVAGVADKIYNLWSPVAFCGFFFVQYVCVCVCLL